MRQPSLDGLRGVAALIVLVTHTLVIFPAASTAFFGGQADSVWLRLLQATPARLFWAGPEAVYVFFVLSGLVLGLMVRSPRFDWRAYVPSRLVRLLVPVVGAVLISAPLLLFAAPFPPNASGWITAHPAAYSVRAALEDVSLLTGTSGSISPLWSLQWEVLFSLLLAPFVLAMPSRRIYWQLALMIGLATAGVRWDLPILMYLPMFGLGVALSAGWEQLERQFGSRSRFSIGLWAVALLAAVGLLTIQWSLRGAGIAAPGWSTLPLQLVGVCVIVVGAAHAPGFRTVLASRPLRFLGAISFSLYLVHEPILVFFARLIREPSVALIAAIPTIVVVTVAFWRFIESPAHRLSRTVRIRLSEPPPQGAAVSPSVSAPAREVSIPGDTSAQQTFGPSTEEGGSQS